MIVRLSDEWMERLRSMPESGMGYQIVDVTLLNGHRLPGLVVLNGETLQAPESMIFEAEDIARITLHRRAER